MAHVLIVDRNPKRAAAVATRLNQVPGLTVRSAREELATVHKLRQDRPDVIMLGTEDGDSWMISILLTAMPTAPIIAYADRWNFQAEARAAALGATHLVPATGTREELLAVLVSALKQHTQAEASNTAQLAA